jgi:ElaB/YqjD/DUF883 family membrane-anchored ribosome-binding protein
MSENPQDKELKDLILSNAKAIQALTENDTEAKKERARLYQIMSDLAQAQADNKKLFYSFMEHTEQRQEELKQRQDKLEEQQQRLIQTQADIAELLKFVITNKT